MFQVNPQLTQRHSCDRRRSWRVLALLGAALPLLASMAAPPNGRPGDFEPRYFSIATGPTAGTYFPVGSMIATIISHPDGSVRCEAPTACGPRGLIAQASASRGSVSNVRDLADGRVDSALAQADVAAWAYKGQKAFKGETPRTELRAIARLYPETVHLAVARGLGVKSMQDLKGKRISLDVEGSGTHAAAERILAAEKLAPQSLEIVQANAERSASLLSARQIDGFFFVGGTPVEVIAGLAARDKIDLVPLTGKGATELTHAEGYFSVVTVPSGTYAGIAELETIAVGALWITRADTDQDLIYRLTRALWDPANREFFARGHPQAAAMRFGGAVAGLPIPLHPGAERFYREKGLLPAADDGAASPGAASPGAASPGAASASGP